MAVVVADRGRPRWIRRLGIALSILVLLFFGGGGWYYSGLIRSDALLVEEAAPAYDFTVKGVSAETITFAASSNPSEDLLSDEILGVRWEGGYGITTSVVSRTDGAIAKQFTLVTGGPPEPGVRVALESDAVPPDPADAGVSYASVTYASDLGEFDAWRTPGNASTWAIFVHGRGATPREGMRIQPTFAVHGVPMLLIEYRNDPGAPAGNGGLATFGVDEWQDLEAAVRYALDEGADSVVLIGHSMGGAIALSFLYESDLADRVVGVILDSPALELGAMVDNAAADTSLPVVPFDVPIVLTATAKWMTSLRFGASWGAMNYLDERTSKLDVPILILHGIEDDTVPIALSRELADERPDIVELVEFRDADHVRSWNVDRARYEAAADGFLNRVLP